MSCWPDKKNSDQIRGLSRFIGIQGPFRICSNSRANLNDKDNADDGIPHIFCYTDKITANVTRYGLPKCIRLKDRNDTIHRRKREAVIRFRKFNSAKVLSSKTWRNEDSGLLGQVGIQTLSHIIMTLLLKSRTTKFTDNLDLID